MVFQITEQPLFVFAELEIIIFFLAKFDFAPFRAELAVGSSLFVSEKLFLPNAVVTGLFVFVDFFSSQSRCRIPCTTFL